jgi:hypothetical protein
MATVHVFVSSGRFATLDDIRRFIEPTYTDGECIESLFNEEVGLEDYTPVCFESVIQAEPMGLAELLLVSYSEQWMHLLDPTVRACEAICVYTPNRVTRPQGSSMLYCGAFPYVV